MKIIKDRINSSLTQNRQVNKTIGREHTSQEIGSCTFKSVSSWLKGSFKDPKEYNKFKAAYTEWDLEKLKSLHQEKTETAHTSRYVHARNKAKELNEKRENLSQMKNMVETGEKILKNRQKKGK